MESGTDFTGAKSWCKKYNLSFISEYRYMKCAMDRLEEEEKLRRTGGKKELNVKEAEIMEDVIHN